MLLGIDAGGTSTRAVAVDERGRCLGYGAAGGGNPISRGPARAGKAIVDAATAALRDAGARLAGEGPPTVSGPAVLAMAGARASLQQDVMTSELRRLGDISRVAVVSDVLAMFSSGTARQSGYTLVAGTGAAAIRVEDGEITAAMDGLGWLLGDGGSGFWIGQRAVRAAVAALSGYGPQTRLATMLFAELGLAQDGKRAPTGRLLALDSAVSRLYELQPVELSRFASMVFDAAGVANPDDVTWQQHRGTADLFPQDADPVAVKILIEARRRLITTLCAARKQQLPGPVVIGGSVAQHLPGMATAIREAFAARDSAPMAGAASAAGPDIIDVADGAVGVAVLALREAGVMVDDEVFARVRSSVTERQRAAIST